MAYTFILVIGLIFWIGYKIFEFISEWFQKSEKIKKKKSEFFENFWNRVIDKDKSLFDRNIDIIDRYISNIHAPWYDEYLYFENKARECIDDIMLAEWEELNMPWEEYITTWKNSLSKEYLNRV